MEQTFTVYGKPIGKGRARITTRGGFAHAYTPKNTADYEKQVREAYLNKYGNLAPSEKPIAVTIVAEFEPTASWSKKKKAAALAQELSHTSKPDLDNVLKSINDAINGMAYKDDSQIIIIEATKRYGTENKVTVTIREVDD